MDVRSLRMLRKKRGSFRKFYHLQAHTVHTTHTLDVHVHCLWYDFCQSKMQFILSVFIEYVCMSGVK